MISSYRREGNSTWVYQNRYLPFVTSVLYFYRYSLHNICSCNSPLGWILQQSSSLSLWIVLLQQDTT